MPLSYLNISCHQWTCLPVEASKQVFLIVAQLSCCPRWALTFPLAPSSGWHQHHNTAVKPLRAASILGTFLKYLFLLILLLIRRKECRIIRPSDRNFSAMIDVDVTPVIDRKKDVAAFMKCMPLSFETFREKQSISFSSPFLFPSLKSHKLPLGGL